MLQTPGSHKMPSLLARLGRAGQAILDLLYPPRCAACGRQGVLFCDDCQAAVLPMPAPACEYCGRPGSQGRLCAACRREPTDLHAIYASGVFVGPLRSTIHEFKYAGVRALAVPLAARLATVWQERGLSADLIVPVPLHSSRERERGYNQSALLAGRLSQATGVPTAPELLVRQRATPPQVGRSAQERRQNVSGAFVCTGDVAGRRILLVDDVCTTGATLAECAAALCARGAGRVLGLTVARARWSNTGGGPELS